MTLTEDEIRDDIQASEKRHSDVRRFDAVYARWLRSMADVIGPLPDGVPDDGDAYEAFMDNLCKTFDAVVEEMSRTPAVFKYQIHRKFEILYDLIDNDHGDDDSIRALIASIQTDIRRMD